MEGEDEEEINKEHLLENWLELQKIEEGPIIKIVGADCSC